MEFGWSFSLPSLAQGDSSPATSPGLQRGRVPQVVVMGGFGGGAL